MTGAKAEPGAKRGNLTEWVVHASDTTPGPTSVLCNLADDLVKIGESLLRQRQALLQTTEVSTMHCPECHTDREGCFSVACWVYVDNGEAAETCGDANYPKPGEPKQAAYCSNCDTIFGPRPGHVFRVVNGRPQEVEL